MELKINNQQVLFDTDTLSIQAMLDIYYPQKQKGIAVAVNQTVIAKPLWSTYHLSTSDDILIITATQGG
ncbi:sulfur carrier protein ThiS [Myroides odoratimimus]|uniref:Thiamine biosynthesis protein ThiS n=1 Tax=Myroides odoratimimus CCUG 10230 TaxID=883150 RepID=A0ABP2N7E4_9FLAO|nr:MULTISPECIES: sulfur carrier protein ThiS [Myroides]AJA68026.1 thiamine biosynthesis protein ThiS [Myroides sp. A21]EHO06691.1 thiamine biosynthesis protein ThiS [Myroides odoratimimus CCUG 10230]MDM1064070.1 sulfur carrier protein ThiS [Myroides odoratimimus]MDM1083495.1 sulfur carrier protein ThiS [Myroides odoratimimus]MDM1456152.1 sulfur carrier protein ThiS [Myroides odoratimimus]